MHWITLTLALGALAGCRSFVAADGGSDTALPLVVDAHVHAAMRLVSGPATSLVDGQGGGQLDAERARRGGLRIAFSAALLGAWEDGDPEVLAQRQFAAVAAQQAAAPDRLALARTPDEAQAQALGGRLVLVHALENGRDLDDDLAPLKRYRDAGVRMLSLVHSSSNNLADSGGDAARWQGLSPLGARAIAEANSLGLWVDLSHASEATILAAARQTRAPLIASHTAAAALVPDNPANLSDTAIRAIADSGGLVCVFFGSEALVRGYLPQARDIKREVVAELHARGIDLSSQEAEAFAAAEFDRRLPRASVADVADHIAHVVRIAGAQHACLGSDFDGIGPTAARGLEDVAAYPALFDELRRRGLDENAIAAVAGGNLLRTWRVVLARAGRGAAADH